MCVLFHQARTWWLVLIVLVVAVAWNKQKSKINNNNNNNNNKSISSVSEPTTATATTAPTEMATKVLTPPTAAATAPAKSIPSVVLPPTAAPDAKSAPSASASASRAATFAAAAAASRALTATDRRDAAFAQLTNRIFSFLDTRELCASQRVSGTFRRLLVGSSALWSNLDLSYCSPLAVTDGVVSKLLRVHTKRVHKLNARFCTKIGANTFQAMADSATELKELILEGCGKHIDDSCLSRLSRGCGQLHTVILYGCHAVTVHGIQQMVQHCASLASIALSNATDQMLDVLASGGGGAGAASASRLHTVRLNGSNITNEGVIRLAESLRGRFRELTVSYCTAISDNAVQSLVSANASGASSKATLRSLTLYGCTNISDVALSALHGCTALTALDLGLCRKITDRGIQALLCGMNQPNFNLPSAGASESKNSAATAAAGAALPPGQQPPRATAASPPGGAAVTAAPASSSANDTPPLESLNVYDCTALTNLSIQLIAAYCPRLKHMGAYGLDEVSSTGLQTLLTRCTSLTSVDFGGCNRLTAPQIDAFAARYPNIRF